MDKRAYYIEYPDREMAVMLKFDGDAEPVIRTSTDLSLGAQEQFIASLMTDGYETFAYTSTLHYVEDREHRHWECIDPADLPEVTLSVEGPDGIMYGKRCQVRGGKVVCAPEERTKGQSQWHVDGAPPRPPHSVEPVALPREFEAKPGA